MCGTSLQSNSLVKKLIYFILFTWKSISILFALHSDFSCLGSASVSLYLLRLSNVFYLHYISPEKVECDRINVLGCYCQETILNRGIAGIFL